MTARTGADVKEGFRDIARSERASVSAARRSEAEHAIAARLADVTSDHHGLVAAYRSIGSELDLGPLTGALAAEGRLVLPRVTPHGLEFVPWRPGDELVRSRFGVEEPLGPAVALADVEVALVPALAFDLRCHRLGYGGGFYDRVLAAPEWSAVAIGVGFEEQIVERLPVGPLDRPVDLVVTDRRTFQRARH